VRLSFLLFCLTACAGPVARPVVPGTPVELAHGEGLLIVHVDTQVPIEALALDRATVSERLPRGRHLWLIPLERGRYRWDRISFGSDSGAAHIHRIDRSDEDFAFDVEPGVINYPGELVLRADVSTRSVSGSVRVRNRNHSAMAVRRLRDLDPDVLRTFPLRHAGASGDTFLEVYSRERKETSEPAAPGPAVSRPP
jgi:hypothetical protein